MNGGGSREGVTIMRTVFDLQYSPASSSDHITFGLQVESINDLATSAALRPDTNPYEPWLLNSTMWPTASGATVDAVTQRHYDIRSKRKVQHIGESLWFSWIPSSTGNSSLAGYFRVLIALP